MQVSGSYKHDRYQILAIFGLFATIFEKRVTVNINFFFTKYKTLNMHIFNPYRIEWHE